ncbi:TPA: amino acid ABC transporter permease, partial [Streptococcus suis]|nr:amino acid ABC transporter permease [Streptococcus suis]
MNYVLELLKPSTFQLLWNGLKLTLYISSISVVLSVLFGMILAIMRNGKNPLFK